MNAAAASILAYGIYYVVAGLNYLISPDFALTMFGFPVEGTWSLRVAGILLGLHGYFYIQAARQELKPFFPWTVHARLAAFVLFVAMVAFGLAQPIIVLFGIIDLAGAIWTWQALRSATR